jgi:low affinity Fe/Cu permease
VTAEEDPGHRAAEIEGEQRGFTHVVDRATVIAGSPWSIAALIALTAVWLVYGWAADFPRSWELVATAGVPIVTLLMVLVLQHSQNHEAKATQLKLDEVIRALDGSSNAMIRVERGSTEELAELEEDFADHAEGARQ